MSQSDAEFISTTGEIFPWKDVRLPSFLTPIDYELHLQPDLVAFQNTGSVRISFQVTSETDFFVLHVKDLKLTQTKLFDYNEREIPITKVLEYTKHDQLYIKTSETLKPSNKYIVSMDFNYELEEKLDGCYLSSYKTADGQKRYLVATHFEPTHARLAFPCFDEPAMKASFSLTIVHKDEHKVYSNTDVEQTSPYGDGLTLTKFEKSVYMSTYLVAFVVCDFKEIECLNESGIKVRVIAPAEQIHEAEYALNVAAKVLTFYETLFGIKYPLTKLDMIAIPDFGSGAMENWGLVTYRMVCILFNQTETSSIRQEYIATTVAHELAHQWFGNLVTMEWWNDLWLNEGFATFVAFLGVDHVHPDWKMMDEIMTDCTLFATTLDCLSTSHPIMVDVKDPYKIKSIFDHISYRKGAAILYMLLDALGMDILTKGICYYLDKYRFKNAKTEDLWNVFTLITKSEQVNDIAKVMDTWTLQKGFPLIYANFSNGHVELRQERFLLTPPDKSNEATNTDISPFNYIWRVPICYITNKDKTRNTFWLNDVKGEFSVSSKISWVKLNANQAGFYRIMYNEEMWKLFIKQLHEDHTVFSSADRAGLLDDALTLAKVGILKSELAMELTKYLEKEQDYLPWEIAIDHFNYMANMLYESPVLPLLQKYVLKLIKPVMVSLGWEDQGSHITKKLRSSILSAALKYKDEDSINKTKTMFDKWMNSDERLSPNLRRVIYTSGIRYGGVKEWQFCWNKYQKCQVPSEKNVLLGALGRTRDYWQLSQYLNLSLDKNEVRPQDMATVIAISAINPIGNFLTWRFIRMHWEKLLNLFGTAFAIKTIISYAISSFNTKFDHDEVKSFFANVETGAGWNDVEQGLETIRANINWKKNVEPKVTQWLQQNVI